MIRYLIDGRPLQDGSAVRGIGTYVRGLLRGLAANGVEGVGLLLERGGAAPAGFSELLQHRSRLLRTNRHLRPFLDPLQVSWALSRDRPRLYHAVEYAQPLQARVPVVVTVHDLIPFVMPDLYPWMQRERALALRQLKRADAVIAVSASTAADANRIAGVDPQRITVIHEGVEPPPPLTDSRRAEVRARLRLPERFLLAVGTFDPRKRVDVLAGVVGRVRVEHDVGLVVAGFQGNFATSVDVALDRAGLAAHARVLGHVAPDDLDALYQMAEALVFTSAYEGFGLPPLEAMAAGTAVALFDNSSLAEVVGDAAVLVADGDEHAMASAVARLLADDEQRARLVATGRARAATFTWRRAAQETHDVYTSLLASR